MKTPTLLHDTKRNLIYQYGNDGKITISKRLLQSNEDLDLIEAIENGDIEIQNTSECKSTIKVTDLEIDTDAFTAVDLIL